MRFRCLLVLLIACSFSVVGTAGDWPSWRGPNRDDVNTETGLLKKWPEGGPKKLWTSTDAGLGYSGFAVVGDVLYTMGSDGKTDSDNDFVIAINTSNGEKIWQTNIGKYLDNGWGGGPRCTPTVAGDVLVAISARGDVVCLSTKDGAEKWKASLTEMGGQVPNWGFCESALIDGDKLIVTPGGPDGTVACLNLADGKPVWRSKELTEFAHYSSVIKVNHFGKDMYIQLTEKKVFGLNPSDGALLWQHDFPGRVAVIPTPIYKNGQVYVTAGYGAGCMLINVTANNQVEKIYENKIMKNHHGGVVLIGDHLYGHSDDRGITCQDFASGKDVWSDAKKNDSKGAVVAADGMLYCLSENAGECFLVEATPNSYKEVSRFTLDPQTKQRSPQGRVWTHPVIANGKLYLRDQEIICCYNIKQ